ncbi:MAG TPA: hydroxymethylbilane synthase [Microthrixaceae bacterium]|nr:hydroxymethylbilane synthase [Microthrixaceae bacterium]
MPLVRLATRGSPLARWQADHVAERLRAAHAGLEVELVTVSTEGDRRRDVPLAEIGGKGVFVKEVQASVLDGRADFAVHSAKDLPAETPNGLVIGAVPERGDARDALVGSTLADLGSGATVATGSRRRACQLLDLRPDLEIVDLRGNIDTRMAKVGEVDAVVVAFAALVRLGRDAEATEVLTPEVMLPQVGQGALAIEARADDAATAELLAVLEHGPTRRRLSAERGFLAELGGDCDLPAGAFAELEGAMVRVRALLADERGLRRVEVEGEDAERVGRDAARRLRGDS